MAISSKLPEKRLSGDERLHTRCLHTEPLPTPSRDSSGSPRLPLPHLIMLNFLDGDNASHNGRLGTSKRSDPDPDRALRAKAFKYPQPEEMDLDVLHARTHAGRGDERRH
ncbi:hypothetical protein E1301_Tti004157 [Triplophysa tibetana]|uniref:Uncharacterized protein n=1 Tax=Triplophysa tibetana TaxID=1572043 RepID=A0A5A9NJ56_9TELE|nr:hypothetical protein E1301_Tti004157 [Triplophysa tibetana]